MSVVQQFSSLNRSVLLSGNARYVGVRIQEFAAESQIAGPMINPRNCVKIWMSVGA